MQDITVQDLITKNLIESDGTDANETLQILEFLSRNGVPLTPAQAKTLFILHEYGLTDLADYVNNIRSLMTPTKKYMDMINKLTLADRIKGNAKLASILKANANPANTLNIDRALDPRGGRL